MPVNTLFSTHVDPSKTVSSGYLRQPGLTSGQVSSETLTGLYDQAAQLLGNFQGESSPRFVGAIKLEATYQITMPTYCVRRLSPQL